MSSARTAKKEHNLEHPPGVAEESQMLAYALSHDMRAPLRNLDYCCHTLKHQHADALPPAAAELLEMAEEASGKLRQQHAALLEYFYISAETAPWSRIPCDALWQEVMAGRSQRVVEKHAEVTHGKLPVIHGHKPQLHKLFGYLLDNALTYVENLPPRIHLSASHVGKAWQFRLEDNGIGIEAEHREIVFALFQRLHTADEYPGLGAGLALARKIAAMHGGTLTVEPAPGGGSCFVLTLPATPH